MKAHTSEFKEQIKTFGRELYSVISYTIDGVDYELSNENLNSVTPHYEGAILKSVMKVLEIDSNIEIPKDTIINYKFGVKVRNIFNSKLDYDFVDYGNYVVYNIEKQEDTGSYIIKCYDRMLYSMISYEKMNVTYPITIRDYINKICNYLGLTFENSEDEFVNYDKEIPNELYLDSEENSLDYTFRDIFDELAQVTASTICINANDKLEVRYINNTNDTIDEEYLKNINVKFGKKYGPINTIVLSRAGGSDKIAQSIPEDLSDDEKTAIVISDNQILSNNNRSDFIPEILNQLYGLEYYINDYESTGICYYNLCDMYNIQIGDNIYNCIMFNDEVGITQGLTEKIYTEMPEESETDYTKTDKTDKKINKAYIEVDKQNQKIDAFVGNENDKYANLQIDVDGLRSTVQTTNDEIENLRETITTQFEQVGDEFNFNFSRLQEEINSNKAETDETINEIFKYIRFVDGNIVLGEEGNEYTLKIENDRVVIYYNDENISSWIQDTFSAKQINIGNFAFVPRSDGSLSFRKVR